MPTNALRYWRVKRGPTITDLADRANVSTRLITKIEADEHYVAKADTMEQISGALNLPVFVIFFPEEYKRIRQAIFNMIYKDMHAMTPDALFNMSRHGPADLQDGPWPSVQPRNTQSYSPAGRA